MTRKIALWMLAALVPVAVMAGDSNDSLDEPVEKEKPIVKKNDLPTHPSDGSWPWSFEEVSRQVPSRQTPTRAWEETLNLGPRRFLLCNRPREMYCLECEYFDKW